MSELLVKAKRKHRAMRVAQTRVMGLKTSQEKATDRAKLELNQAESTCEYWEDKLSNSFGKMKRMTHTGESIDPIALEHLLKVQQEYQEAVETVQSERDVVNSKFKQERSKLLQLTLQETNLSGKAVEAKNKEVMHRLRLEENEIESLVVMSYGRKS